MDKEKRVYKSLHKINALLALKEITFEDLKQLSAEEDREFSKIVTRKYHEAKGVEKDKLLKKIENIINEGTKNAMWEENHGQITYAISTLMQDYGRMPSKTELAQKTGLSRQTIHKHLKNYATNPLYVEQMEQFRFMNAKVLAKVFQFAVNGDMRAAKLYFEAMGGINGQTANNTFIQSQNNYIQVNGTVLSQDNIKQLNPEQLNQIEEIIKAALPPPLAKGE